MKYAVFQENYDAVTVANVVALKEKRDKVASSSGKKSVDGSNDDEYDDETDLTPKTYSLNKYADLTEEEYV